MKEDQPKPGDALKIVRAENPPAPVRPQIEELQAQTLALRTVVEAMLARPEFASVRAELVRSSNSMVHTVAETLAHTVTEKVVERAKKIVHLELRLPRK